MSFTRATEAEHWFLEASQWEPGHEVELNAERGPHSSRAWSRSSCLWERGLWQYSVHKSLTVGMVAGGLLWLNENFLPIIKSPNMKVR